MASEAEQTSDEAPKLAIYSAPVPAAAAGISLKSGVGNEGTMGISTPPHHTASITITIPFRWEEEPGKPRPCKTTDSAPPFRGIDLPPRLIKITKTPSPTTVFEGPYVGSRSIFHSFNITKNREAASSDGSGSGGSSPESGLLGSLVLGRTNKHKGTFVFSTSRKRRLLGLTKARSSFWETICGAVKHVIACPKRRMHK